MVNCPKLLTQKPKSRGKKSASDDNKDYDPTDNLCDTEDMLEDIQLENQTVVENKEKCNNINKILNVHEFMDSNKRISYCIQIHDHFTS